MPEKLKKKTLQHVQNLFVFVKFPWSSFRIFNFFLNDSFTAASFLFFSIWINEQNRNYFLCLISKYSIIQLYNIIIHYFENFI